MRVVVCIKQVIDIGFNFDLDPNTCNIAENDIFYTVNPADRCASELAVRFKEKFGAEVIFVALGPNRVQDALRSCLAMGGDKAVHILDASLAGLDATAYMLAMAIKDLAPDIILCGNQSLDEAGSEVPASIAGVLDLPQATGVLDMELSPDSKKATVQCKLEKGKRQQLECSLPAIFAIELGAVQPRYASLPGLLDAHLAEIQQVRIGESDIDSSALSTSQRKLVSLSLPRPRPKKTFTIDTKLSAEQRLQMMMSGGVKESKSSVWEGDPKELAKRLADILKRERLE